MTKSQYSQNLSIIKGNLKNAVLLTARIADDANLTTNGIINIKSLDEIIEQLGKFATDFEKLQVIMKEIKTKLEAADAN